MQDKDRVVGAGKIVPAVALLAWVPVAASTFEGLGDLPGGRFYSNAHDVSPDGRVVVGASNRRAPFHDEAFVWTRRTGMVGLGFLPGGGELSSALAVSGRGEFVVGYSDRGERDPVEGLLVEAFLWTPREGMRGLGLLPGGRSSVAHGVSADGRIIVGTAHDTVIDYFEAFRWSPDTGMVGLGFLPGDSMSAATDVSADGDVVVGYSAAEYTYEEAVRWSASGGVTRLGFPPGGENSEASGVSADGRFVVGDGIVAELVPGPEALVRKVQAFGWSAATGIVTLEGSVGASSALGISPDGSVAVGRYIDSAVLAPDRAAMWDHRNGGHLLECVLREGYGLGDSLEGWELWQADAASRQGLVIVGNGQNPSGQVEAWVARLDVPPPQLDLAALCPPFRAAPRDP